MSFRLAAVAALIALLAAVGPAAADDDSGAMTFTLWHSDAGVSFGEGSRDYIFAEGDITADTPAAFQKYLDQNPPKLANTSVVLNSDGGDLGAGLALGRLIRQYKLWTQVGELLPVNIGVSPTVAAKMVPYLRKAASPPFAGYCYSSCTVAFLGGVFRFIDYGSDYGVHRFSFTNPAANTDLADQSQEMSGELVKYVVEMGVNAQFITQMSLKGPSDINHLTMQQMVSLNVVTPRWNTKWRVTPLSDGSGFFLGGWTADEWGLHEIAIACAPPAAAGGTVATPNFLISFKLDPGARGSAADLVKSVQHYMLELDAGAVPVPDEELVQPASVATSKARTLLAAQIRISNQFLGALLQSNHIGFAYLFDPAAGLPMRLIQFEGDLDAKLLKKFAATCH